MTDGASVLELGGWSVFTDAMKTTKASVSLHTDDVRYPFAEASESFDLVVAMEIMEHVGPREARPLTEFRFDGVENMLREAYRVLKPGGVLFLTTPDVNSPTTVYYALVGGIPMNYRLHAREYPKMETERLVRESGFQIESSESLTMYEYTKKCKATCHETWGLNIERGDTVFLQARKPSSTISASPQDEPVSPLTG